VTFCDRKPPPAARSYGAGRSSRDAWCGGRSRHFGSCREARTCDSRV